MRHPCLLRVCAAALVLAAALWSPTVAQVPTQSANQTIARADALNQSGTQHKHDGRWGEAAKDYASAVALYRSAGANDASYAPIIASLLHNLGYLYLKQNLPQEARKAYEEALGMYRTMAEKDERYLPKVPQLLITLAQLSRNERHGADRAAGFAEEALRINRSLAQKNPGAYRSKVADSMEELGAAYRDQHRFVEAQAILHEAIDIYRSLPLDNPQQLADLARKLNYVAIRLGEAGYQEEARAAYADSISVCRFLAARNAGGDENTKQLAQSLVNLGISYSVDNRIPEMQKAHDEALSLYLALAQKNPDRYLETALDHFHAIVTFNKNDWGGRKQRYVEAARLLESLDRENKYSKVVGWIRRSLPPEGPGS